MVVKGKIEKPEADIEKERMKIIKQGAPVSRSESDKWINFTLRISRDQMEEIEEALKDTVGISKTGWILQALREKTRKKE